MWCISTCTLLCRALEIAVKHKTHVDTVLAFREVYLKQIECSETLQNFQKYTGKVCARVCVCVHNCMTVFSVCDSSYLPPPS